MPASQNAASAIRLQHGRPPPSPVPSPRHARDPRSRSHRGLATTEASRGPGGLQRPDLLLGLADQVVLMGLFPLRRSWELGLCPPTLRRTVLVGRSARRGSHKSMRERLAATDARRATPNDGHPGRRRHPPAHPPPRAGEGQVRPGEPRLAGASAPALSSPSCAITAQASLRGLGCAGHGERSPGIVIAKEPNVMAGLPSPQLLVGRSL